LKNEALSAKARIWSTDDVTISKESINFSVKKK
jgi:hypothetical protein